MERSDEALMLAYQQGEEAALESLVRRHADSLLGYLVRMTHNRPTAEDVFQETFLRVHTKARSFRPDGRFKPWLYAIATHLAIDNMRRRRPEKAAVSFDAEPEEGVPLSERIASGNPGPADLAARSDQAARVRAAIQHLPPRQRATLMLAYFEGLSYPEVARTLKCSVGTVKTQMSRALHTLARLLPQPDLAGARGGAA